MKIRSAVFLHWEDARHFVLSVGSSTGQRAEYAAFDTMDEAERYLVEGEEDNPLGDIEGEAVARSGTGASSCASMMPNVAKPAAIHPTTSVKGNPIKVILANEKSFLSHAKNKQFDADRGRMSHWGESAFSDLRNIAAGVTTKRITTILFALKWVMRISTHIGSLWLKKRSVRYICRMCGILPRRRHNTREYSDFLCCCCHRIVRDTVWIGERDDCERHAHREIFPSSHRHNRHRNGVVHFGIWHACVCNLESMCRGVGSP